MTESKTYPTEGEAAPSFTLNDQDGSATELPTKGTVVLYFYPRDDTPGCTKEACGFRDAYSEYEKRDVVVLGVSPDNAEKHQAFIEKHNLKTGKQFKLLSDPDKEMMKSYGAYGEKTLYGKLGFGVIRSTFLIRDGVVVKVYRKVDTSTHAQDILSFLDEGEN